MRALTEEYRGRVNVEWLPLPLEWVNSRPTPRHILDQEWWLAALHEPRAPFAPYTAPTYPDTTLPAFHAHKAARLQGYEQGHRYDLLLREGFFGRSLDISDSTVLLRLAEEAGLDLDRFERDRGSEEVNRMVQEEYRASEFLDPRGSPSFVLPDGTQHYDPAAADVEFEHDVVVGVGPMPCLGEGCDEVYRGFLKATVRQAG